MEKQTKTPVVRNISNYKVDYLGTKKCFEELPVEARAEHLSALSPTELRVLATDFKNIFLTMYNYICTTPLGEGLEDSQYNVEMVTEIVGETLDEPFAVLYMSEVLESFANLFDIHRVSVKHVEEEE